MQMHCLSYAAAAAAVTTEQDIAAMTDDLFAISNNHFLPQKDWYLQWACAMGITLARARLITPNFRQISPPQIMPIEVLLTPGARPNVADYRNNPLKIRGLEELQYAVFENAVERAACLLGFSDGPLMPMPAGDIYTIRFSSTTAAVAHTWTSIASTPTDTLPAGRFAMVGLSHNSATGKGCRVIFEDSQYRPGSVSMSAPGSATHPMFRMGGLGIWGYFNANRMPIFQVHCNAADAAHEIFVDFVRVA